MNGLFADSALCGPSNDLKTLTSRLDRDNGARQDAVRYNAQAGPSRQLPFRALPSQTPLNLGHSATSPPTTSPANNPFDLSSLHRALSPPHQQPPPHVSPHGHVHASSSPGWTSEYGARDLVVHTHPPKGLHETWNDVQRRTRDSRGQPQTSTAPQHREPVNRGKQPEVSRWNQSYIMDHPQRNHFHQPQPMESVWHRSGMSPQPYATPHWATPPPSVEFSHPVVQPQPPNAIQQSNDPNALADVARQILHNPAVQSERQQHPEGGTEFFGLMEKLANGGSLDSSAQEQETPSSMVGEEGVTEQQDAIADPYMPSVDMPRFAPDGSLLRTHAPLSGAPTTVSDWTTAFDRAESEYLGTKPGPSSRRVQFQTEAGAKGYSVPANLMEALSGSVVGRASTSTPQEEEPLDEDDAAADFAEFYGRQWRPEAAQGAAPTSKERWHARDRAQPSESSRVGDEQVEGLRAAAFGLTESQERGRLEESQDTLEYLERAKTWREDEASGYMRGKSATRGSRDMYVFQKDNPYVHGMERGRIGDMAGERMLMPELAEENEYRNVLESEAAVLMDPTNSRAWYDLGIKQQENERDDQATQALLQAIKLDPSMRESYLALSVSYCNEGELKEAHGVLETWIDLVEGRASPIEAARAEDGLHQNGSERLTRNQRHEMLTNALMEMARRAPVGEVDADVQIALGVLFNASEEYDKAQDCFRTALQVRPDDWMLYNRLGAVLANGGKSSEALEYYHGALQLHPGYVRAMFNIGISSIKLARYHEAGQYILDAIRLQHSSASEGYSSAVGSPHPKGVTSGILWQTLRTACMHLNRHDLTEHCVNKNLSAFNNEFMDG